MFYTSLNDNKTLEPQFFFRFFQLMNNKNIDKSESTWF